MIGLSIAWTLCALFPPADSAHQPVHEEDITHILVPSEPRTGWDEYIQFAGRTVCCSSNPELEYACLKRMFASGKLLARSELFPGRAGDIPLLNQSGMLEMNNGLPFGIVRDVNSIVWWSSR